MRTAAKAWWPLARARPFRYPGISLSGVAGLSSRPIGLTKVEIIVGVGDGARQA